MPLGFHTTNVQTQAATRRRTAGRYFSVRIRPTSEQLTIVSTQTAVEHDFS